MIDRKVVKIRKVVLTMTKMTYVKAIEIAINAVADEEVKEKLEALKISLEKKSSTKRKPTATQLANQNFKIDILDGMAEGQSYTITDLVKSIDSISDLSNQRVSAIVRQLVESGDIVRTEIKNRAYFSKVIIE